MDFQHRKLLLIEKIIHSSNNELIQRIEELLSSKEDKLTDIEIQLIEKGREDIKNGRVSSNSEVKNRIKEKFNF